MTFDLKSILDLGEAGGFAVPAFNVYNLETVLGVMKAAEETGAPVIFQMYSRLFDSELAQYVAPVIREAIDFVSRGFMGRTFGDIVDNLISHDPYMVLADFESYRDAQRRAGELYLDKPAFGRASIKNIAGAGIFSADRAVSEYAKNIWNMEPLK